MAKRILDCAASDFARMTKEELLFAIGASEGRTLAAETIGTVTPLLGDVTNAELAAALGADILLLNLFDVDAPQLQGLPPVGPGEVIREVKRLTGRPVGINLEPVEAGAGEVDSLWAMTRGRMATLDNAKKAVQTGTPGTGVTNRAITDTLELFHAHLGDRLILCAGKMHASGVPGEGGENIITPADVEAFARAGADVILLPAPGTVPGITTPFVRGLVEKAHLLGKLWPSGGCGTPTGGWGCPQEGEEIGRRAAARIPRPPFFKSSLGKFCETLDFSPGE